MVYIGKNLQLIIDYRDMSPSTILIIYYRHILSFFTLKPQLEITIDLVLEPATLDLKTQFLFVLSLLQLNFHYLLVDAVYFDYLVRKLSLLSLETDLPKDVNILVIFALFILLFFDVFMVLLAELVVQLFSQELELLEEGGKVYVKLIYLVEDNIFQSYQFVELMVGMALEQLEQLLTDEESLVAFFSHGFLYFLLAFVVKVSDQSQYVLFLYTMTRTFPYNFCLLRLCLHIDLHLLHFLFFY